MSHLTDTALAFKAPTPSQKEAVWERLPGMLLLAEGRASPNHTYINGAAHEGASLDSFPHDLVHVAWSILDFKKLRHPACEVLHGFRGVPTFQSFVGTVEPWREEKSQSGD